MKMGNSTKQKGRVFNTGMRTKNRQLTNFAAHTKYLSFRRFHGAASSVLDSLGASRRPYKGKIGRG
jgi:hypothetical protein